MKTEHNIQFRRIVRGDRTNAHARAVAAATGRKQPLVIDWEVLIDGEHRATFERKIGYRGFTLLDLLSRKIAWRKSGTTPVLKDDFARVIRTALPNIPTVAAIEAERTREAEERALKEAEAERSRIEFLRKERVLSAAPGMLATLQAALPFVHDANTRLLIAKTIAEATGESA